MNTTDRMGASLHLGRVIHLLAVLTISSMLLSFGAIPALAAGPSGHVQPATTMSNSGVAEKSSGVAALNEDDEDDDDEDDDEDGSGGGDLPATDTVGPSALVQPVAAFNEDDEDDDDEDDDEDGEDGGGDLPATDTVSASTETGGVLPLSLGALAIAGAVAAAMNANRKRNAEESAS